jgi:hypothetical protein
MLWEWKLDFLADDAEIIFSELVSNAIRECARRAAGGDPTGEATVVARMLAGPGRLLILVWDPAVGLPVVADVEPAADRETGRGLLLVSALATRWHWYHSSGPHGGKVVWALLGGHQGVGTCVCGFAATERDGLLDHLEETFAARDDRDADGVAHAEAAHDTTDATVPYQCLCGHVAGDAVALDAHLLAVFTPNDRAGRDGQAHAPARP